MKKYIAIDLKSFYASVECVERGRDPLTTNLVVADSTRTEKTICLAVSPSLKAYGIPGRARLFEVVQKVKDVNEQLQVAVQGKYDVCIYMVLCRTRREVRAGLLTAYRPPGIQGALQAHFRCALFRLTEYRRPVLEQLPGDGGGGIREHRADVTFRIPEEMSFIAFRRQSLRGNADRTAPARRLEQMEEIELQGFLRRGVCRSI